MRGQDSPDVCRLRQHAGSGRMNGLQFKDNQKLTPALNDREVKASM